MKAILSYFNESTPQALTVDLSVHLQHQTELSSPFVTLAQLPLEKKLASYFLA